MKYKTLYKPSKEWLNKFYRCDKNIVEADKTEYSYFNNHLNFRGAEKYLNNIIKVLNKYDNGYDNITFIKSQPCIYNNTDYKDNPYWWSYPGKICIYINKNCELNKKSMRYIKKQIKNLNIGYEYICVVIYNDIKIYNEIK